MKAGDLLMSSANTWTSWGIRIGTVSSFSHVAMAISDREVIESTPDGTAPKDLAKFLEDNSKVVLLVRPSALTPDQEELLQRSAIKMQRPDYGLPRSLTSGVARFGFWAWLASLIFGNAVLLFRGAPWLVLVIYNLLLCLLLLVVYTCSHPERFNRVIDMLRLPNFMKTDVDKHFCSQLVVELDKLIQGGLSKPSRESHELRPKDVEQLALNKLGYERVQLKPR